MNDYKNFIKNLVEKNPFGYFTLLKHKYVEIYDFLIKKFDFLKKLNKPLSEICYWFLYDLSDFPKCKNPNCNNKVTTFTNINLGYKSYCSRLCMQTDPETEKKREKTNIKKFNVPFAAQADIVKQNHKKTIEHKIQQNPNYYIEIGKKIKNTFSKKLKNDSHYWYKIKEKQKETNIKNGKPKNWNNRQKAKETKDKHIKENPNYYSDIATKAKETKNKNRQLNPNYQAEINKKCILTKVKNGHTTKSIIEKIKNTKLKRYNDPYYRNSKKAKQTCLEKYGVESYTQTDEYAKKRTKKYINPKYTIQFDSQWEFLVYDFCIQNNINVEYQPNIKFQYIFDNKTHWYKPDFKINNKIYEIKGDHFFKNGKMICPFKSKEKSDIEYLKKCQLYNCKYQCMLQNNVIILKYSEISNLNISMFK